MHGPQHDAPKAVTNGFPGANVALEATWSSAAIVALRGCGCRPSLSGAATTTRPMPAAAQGSNDEPQSRQHMKGRPSASVTRLHACRPDAQSMGASSKRSMHVRYPGGRRTERRELNEE